MEFFKRLFGGASASAPLPVQAPLPPVSEPAPWTELLEQVQKLSRSNARLSLKVEDLDKKVEGGFADLRSQVATPKGAEVARPDELFDALDALDEACFTTRQLQPELADGLERVARRLEQASLQQTWRRVKPLGQLPDGRLFKVVGSVSAPGLAEGVVARVVRAAITTRDGSTVREGEVLTSKKESS